MVDDNSFLLYLGIEVAIKKGSSRLSKFYSSIDAEYLDLGVGLVVYYSHLVA